MFHVPAKPALLVLLAVFSLMLFVSVPEKAHAQNLPIIGVFSSYESKANFTDPSLTVGSTFAIQVNVTNAPLFNAFEFALYYDQNYVSLSSYDFATGTVFDHPFTSPGTFNGPGALRLSVFNENNGNNNNGFYAGGTGMLANITFTVVQAGVSPLTLAAGIAHPSSEAAPPVGLCPSCPPGAPNWTRLVADGNLPDGTALSSKVQVDTTDGHFSDVLGTFGPIASFNISPANPSQGDTITFNATASFDPDNLISHNNGTAEYTWDFGDLSPDSTKTVVFPITTHAFLSVSGAGQFVGNFSVRLTVKDADQGFQGMFVREVTVSRTAQHCVTVETISTSGDRYNRGDTALVSIRVKDAGTYPETFNLTITYGPPNATLVIFKNQNIRVDQSIPYNATIKTSNLLSGAYNLVGTVQLVGTQNCAQGTKNSQFLISPPSSASALLLIVGGVVLIPIAAVILTTLLRRMRRKPEPL